MRHQVIFLYGKTGKPQDANTVLKEKQYGEYNPASTEKGEREKRRQRGKKGKEERKEERRIGTIDSITIGGRACRGRTGRKILTLRLYCLTCSVLIPLNKYYLEGAVKKRQKSSFKNMQEWEGVKMAEQEDMEFIFPLKYIKNTSINGTTAEGEILQNSF